MPESWEWVTVDDISVSILYGVSESAKTNGNYKLLRITDIQDNNVFWDKVPFTDYDSLKAEAYILHEGDILFARTGATVGKSYLVKNAPPNIIYASYLIRIKISHEVYSEYLKLFFESGFYWQQISDGSLGIGQPNVNGSSLGKLKLPVPPKAEQSRIISKIDTFTNLITSLEIDKNILLQKINAAKSKILDLAMQGKLVPQDPADEPAADMLRRINPKAKIITDNQQYCPASKRWIFIKLQDVAQILMGQSPNGDSINNEDGIEFHQGKLYFGDTFLSMSPDKTNAPIKIIDGENILLCVRAPVGIVNKCKRKICIGRGLAAISPSEAVNYNFLFYVLKYLRPIFETNSTGSTFKAITGDVIKSAVIPVPPLNEQTRIVTKIEELFSILDSIEASLQS
ncbi:MAG: restriction endonuclease subunit S [Muribaculaceae bacterium]